MLRKLLTGSLFVRFSVRQHAPNAASPLFSALRNIVLKTVDLVAPLRER
jgi:hypothetical protein